MLHALECDENEVVQAGHVCDAARCTWSGEGVEIVSRSNLCCEQQIFETMAGTVSARCRSAEVPVDVQSITDETLLRTLRSRAEQCKTPRR